MKKRKYALKTGSAAAALLLSLTAAAPIMAQGFDQPEQAVISIRNKDTNKGSDNGSDSSNNTSSSQNKNSSTSSKSTSKTVKDQNVEIILVNKEDGNVIAVMEVKSKKGKIKASDLKLPVNVELEDDSQVIDITELTPDLNNELSVELPATTTNEVSTLKLTYELDGKEVWEQTLTQQVEGDKDGNVEFEEGLNFDIPKGYKLSKEQDDKNAEDLTAIDVAYGKEQDVTISIDSLTTKLDVDLVENGKTIKTLNLSEDGTDKLEKEGIQFVLDQSELPADTEFDDTNLTFYVAPGDEDKAEVKVKTAGGQSSAASDAGQNASSDQSGSTSGKPADSSSGSTSGNTSESTSGNASSSNSGNTQDSSGSQTPSSGNTSGSQTDTSEPQTETASIRITFVNADGQSVGTQSFDENGPAGQSFALNENLLAIPEGYKLEQAFKPVDCPFGKTTNITVNVVSTSEEPAAPSEPSDEPETKTSSVTVIYQLEDGSEVGKETIHLTYQKDEVSQDLEAGSLTIPAGYELSSPFDPISVEAGTTPEVKVIVKAVEATPPADDKTPELKTATVNYVYKDAFSGQEVSTSSASQQQTSESQKDYVFKADSAAIPAGYALNGEFKDVTVPYGQTKDVTLQVVKCSSVTVIFVDNGQQVGKTYQYYFEQTSKDQTSAQLKAADLAFPEGYELDGEAGTVYTIPLGENKTIQVPVKAIQPAREDMPAVLKIQYYVESNGVKQIVSTQTITSATKGQQPDTYAFEFGKNAELKVPAGYKLKSNGKLGTISIKYGMSGTIELEVVKDTAHTSTSTSWYLYAGIGAAALLVGIFLIVKSRNSSKKK